MEAPHIEKTIDYDIFKSVGFNREKNQRHVENLKKIILKENLLHLHPILVNKQMEVIDGQHRLQAAKELGIEVYYIISNVSYDHILNSNLFQKKLSLNDVIKFYAIKDRISDYQTLREYLALLEVNPKSLLGLLFGTASRSIVDFIRSGKFKMPDETNKVDKIIDAYLRLKSFILEKRITPRAMFSSTFFSIAYRNLVLLSSFNEDVFFSKLENRWFEMKPQASSKDWTRLLISIYNWKNQNPISLNGIEEN